MTELSRLRRRQNWLLLWTCVILVWLVRLSFGSDYQVAHADRQRFPESDWPYLYYFGLESIPPEQRDELAKVLAFTVCSLTDQVVVEQQLPVDVGSDVYRIDTRALGWEHTLPQLLAKHYPYAYKPGLLPLVIRPDWFVQFALDQDVGGQAYFLLLFGREVNQLKDFLSLVDAENKSPLEHGHIEDSSGVAVNGTRLVTTVPTGTRHDVWITYDFAELNQQTDPLQHLDRKFKHDASEIIGALPKTIAATGETGILQVYALANAAGAIQFKAPADIVTDGTNVRGVEIRNAVSCIVCHTEGLRSLNKNALRQFIQSGAEAFADYQSREEIERFHLTSLGKLIDRQNEDYAAVIKAINGYTTAQNAAAVANVIANYDAPVTLDRMAIEHLISPEDLRLALGYAGSLPARVAQLAHGMPIARSIAEDEYRNVYNVVTKWRIATQPNRKY
jgi:hypothetical protein